MLTPEQIKYLDEQTGLQNQDEVKDVTFGQNRAKEILDIAKQSKDAQARSGLNPIQRFFRGAAKSIVADPAKALITRPGVRTGQAIGALGLKLADKLTGGKVNKFLQSRTGQTLDERIAKASGEDVKLGDITMSEGLKEGQSGIKQIVGEGVEAGVDIASLGGASIGGKFVKGATGTISGIGRGALAGGATGAIYGGGSGVAQGLKEDLSGEDIAVKGLTGATIGGAAGAVLGGLAGGTTGFLNKRATRHKEIEEGLKGLVTPAEKLEHTREAIKASEALDIDRAIKVGDVAREEVYQSGKTLTEGFAKGRIDDVAMKLDMVDPSLGEKFRAQINPASTTYDDIVKTGLETLDDFGRVSTDAVGHTVDKAGKIVVDPQAKEALAKGIDPTDVQFIKNSSEADKSAFRKMLETAQKASKDKTVSKRPVEEAGRAIVDRVKFIDKARKEAGKELGALAKGMAQDPVDISATTEKFLQNLDEAGIGVIDNIKGTPIDDTLDFSNSRYANQPAAQKQLKKAFDFLFKTDGNVLTPKDIIANRQRMFTDLNYAKSANEIAPGDFVEVILKNVYDTIDDPIKNANPAYAQAAQKYAQTSEALREFGNLVGKNFDLTDDLINLRAGEVGNRILGNASARPLGVIKNLEDVSKMLGHKGDDSIRNKVLFADLLEDLFGTTQTRSLRGQVGKGVADAEQVIDIGKNVAKGSFFDAAKDTYNLIRNRTPEAKIEALRKLIGG